MTKEKETPKANVQKGTTEALKAQTTPVVQKQPQWVAILKEDMPQFAALIRLNGAGENAEVLARQELAYLESAAMTNPKIFQCEKLSIVLGIKWALKNNLIFMILVINKLFC